MILNRSGTHIWNLSFGVTDMPCKQISTHLVSFCTLDSTWRMSCPSETWKCSNRQSLKLPGWTMNGTFTSRNPGRLKQLLPLRNSIVCVHLICVPSPRSVVLSHCCSVPLSLFVCPSLIDLLVAFPNDILPSRKKQCLSSFILLLLIRLSSPSFLLCFLCLLSLCGPQREERYVSLSLSFPHSFPLFLSPDQRQ